MNVCAPDAVEQERARPAAVADGLADTSAWAARVPVLRSPAVRVTAPDAVSVVPAAIVVVARKSSAPRACDPVTVPPAKTTSDDAGSTVPAV